MVQKVREQIDEAIFSAPTKLKTVRLASAGSISQAWQRNTGQKFDLTVGARHQALGSYASAWGDVAAGSERRGLGPGTTSLRTAVTPAYQLAVQAFLSAVLPRGTSGVPKSPRTASRALTCRASRSTQARRGGRGACAHVAATTFGFGTIHEHLRKTARANSWLGAFGHHRGKKSPGRLKTPCYFGPRRAVSAGSPCAPRGALSAFCSP